MGETKTHDNFYMALFQGGLWVVGQRERIHEEYYLTKALLYFSMGGRLVIQNFPGQAAHIDFPLKGCVVVYHVSEVSEAGKQIRRTYAEVLDKMDQALAGEIPDESKVKVFGSGPRPH